MVGNVAKILLQHKYAHTGQHRIFPKQDNLPGSVSDLHPFQIQQKITMAIEPDQNVDPGADSDPDSGSSKTKQCYLSILPLTFAK